MVLYSAVASGRRCLGGQHRARGSAGAAGLLALGSAFEHARVSFVCYQSRAIIFSHPPAPMNHVKYLRAGPAEMPFQKWYTANTNHFDLTDSVRWKSNTQLG